MIFNLPSALRRNQTARQDVRERHFVFEVGGGKYFLTTPSVAGHFEVRPYPGWSPMLRNLIGTRHAGSFVHPTQLRMKLLAKSFQDPTLGVCDVLVIQSIEIHPEQRRKGLATGLLRRVAILYPDALIEGSNPSADARQWHAYLDRVMPTRMLTFTRTRVTPGSHLNYSELY